MASFFKDPRLHRIWNLQPAFNEIQVSIIIPVFNQSQIISKVLEDLLNSISLTAEIIVIDDGSEDNSLYSIIDFFDTWCHKSSPNLVQARLFVAKYSRFETFCDDFGIRISLSNYCLEVQADMFIQDYGFDQRMVELMKRFPDIALLSGRGVERLEPIAESYQLSLGTEAAFIKSVWSFAFIRIFLLLKNKIKSIFCKKLRYKAQFANILESRIANFILQSEDSFLKLGMAGRLGDLIENSQSATDISPTRVYLGETVMRGPLLFDKSKYLSLGGLNTNAFFLGFDDHDFCCRIASAKMRVGYTPVCFSSPLYLGANRKKRTARSEILIFLNIIRIRKFRKRTYLYNELSFNTLHTFKPEIRLL